MGVGDDGGTEEGSQGSTTCTCSSSTASDSLPQGDYSSQRLSEHRTETARRGRVVRRRVIPRRRCTESASSQESIGGGTDREPDGTVPGRQWLLRGCCTDLHFHVRAGSGGVGLHRVPG